MEQRTIIKATNRALDYAHKHGVTLIAAEGNEPPTSTIRPSTTPAPTTRPARSTTGTWTTLPDDADRGPPRHHCQRGRSVHEQGRLLELQLGVHGCLGAGRLVPRLLRDAAAPGGREHCPVRLSPVGRDRERGPESRRHPNTPFVVRDCQGGTCAYYQYLQGTSMASPHAVGVAALIISQFGKRDGGKCSTSSR